MQAWSEGDFGVESGWVPNDGWGSKASVLPRVLWGPQKVGHVWFCSLHRWVPPVKALRHMVQLPKPQTNNNIKESRM